MVNGSLSFAEIILRPREQDYLEERKQSEYVAHQENHINSGELLKSIIYGGIDGCINILLIILSGVSSGTKAHEVFIICISTIIGDGISMGLGDYLSANAEIKYIKAEQEREHYEVQHLLQVQKKEIVEIYLTKGFTQQDSTKVADLYSKNPQAFVNIMMLEELGLVVIDEATALKCGIATFISFIFFGGIPAFPYIISAGVLRYQQHQWIAVVCIGIAELFSLGFAKAALIGLKPWKSGLQSLVLGSIIVAIGYGLGFAFK